MKSEPKIGGLRLHHRPSYMKESTKPEVSDFQESFCSHINSQVWEAFSKFLLHEFHRGKRKDITVENFLSRYFSKEPTLNNRFFNIPTLAVPLNPEVMCAAIINYFKSELDETYESVGIKGVYFKHLRNIKFP